MRSRAATVALLVVAGLAALVVDLLGLLLVPVRGFGVHLPVGAFIALLGNAGLGVLVVAAAGRRATGYLLTGTATTVALFALTTGPGGDVLVPVSLLWPFLLYLLGALGGAGLALRRR